MLNYITKLLKLLMETKNLKIFRDEYMNANSWALRKDGVPLNLLDKLTIDELKIAEKELIEALNLGDSWQIIGLGYIKSKEALPMLYELLGQSKMGIRVTIAHSIYQICQDEKMIQIALDETKRIESAYELIDVFYLLVQFKDSRIREMVDDFRNHTEYLVAYNATQALGLPTKGVVEKFRNE
jgi:hypothetical protein